MLVFNTCACDRHFIRLLCQGRRVVYLPNCGASYESLESDLRAALLVAFGDDASSTIRHQIARCQTRDQLATFCSSQPVNSLIFVLDQFNAVQEDSAITYRGSKQEFVRDFLIKVQASIDLIDLLVYFIQLFLIGIVSDLPQTRLCSRVLGQQLHCSLFGFKAAK